MGDACTSEGCGEGLTVELELDGAADAEEVWTGGRPSLFGPSIRSVLVSSTAAPIEPPAHGDLRWRVRASVLVKFSSQRGQRGHNAYAILYFSRTLT